MPKIKYEFSANLGTFEHEGNVSMFSRNHRNGKYIFKFLDFFDEKEAQKLCRDYVNSQLTKNKN